MKKTLLSLTVVLLFSLLAFGNNCFAGGLGPGLEFAVTEHDFAMVRENGKKVSYDFVVKNTGDSPLVITRIITSCKCVSTSYTKKPIPPGGEGMVSVTYDPKKQQGVFYKAIQVFSNAPEGMHIVIIKGEVVQPAR